MSEKHLQPYIGEYVGGTMFNPSLKGMNGKRLKYKALFLPSKGS